MGYYQYIANCSPSFLNQYVEDSRIKAGDYTYFESHITFALWNPSEQIEIGKFCSLARDITIFGGGEHFTSRATTYPLTSVVSLGKDRPEKINNSRTKGATIIGNDVWIGLGATVMSGVKIGSGAVIAARAVVAKDVPDYAIAVGNPAKVTRYRFQPQTIERLLELSWWNWEFTKIVANLDLLYQNPDTWPVDLVFR